MSTQKTWTQMFTALFAITKKWKETMSTNGGMDKENVFIATQGNIIQPRKGMRCGYVLQHEWTSKTLYVKEASHIRSRVPFV